jgi:signal peptidase II
MTQPKPPLNASGIRWLWVSALLMVLDQVTKLWIVATMPGDETIHVLPVFDIIHTVNPGAAWSMGANTPGARWVFSAVAVGVSVMLVAWLRGLAWSTHKLLIMGLTFILGGAIGNVIDRVRLGHVIDFLSVHWGNAYFPAFNVADSAICIGAGFVVVDSLREWLRERREKGKGKLEPGVEGGGDR